MTQSTFAPSLQSVSHFASGNGVAAALDWAAVKWRFGHGLQPDYLRQNLQPDELQSNQLQSGNLQSKHSQRCGWQYPCASTSGVVSMPMVFLSSGMVWFDDDRLQFGADRRTGYQSGEAVALRQASGRYSNEVTVLTH